MTHEDYCMTALALWREARGEGNTGMLAVACVIRNRFIKRNSTFYAEVIKPWAFSSITAKGDVQLGLYPAEPDLIWQQAKLTAANVIDNIVADITGGATLYWNPAGIESTKTFTLSDGSVVAFPSTWNAAVVAETCRIGAHIFLKEL